MLVVALLVAGGGVIGGIGIRNPERVQAASAPVD
jgi:hypothetical protein